MGIRLLRIAGALLTVAVVSASGVAPVEPSLSTPGDGEAAAATRKSVSGSVRASTESAPVLFGTFDGSNGFDTEFADAQDVWTGKPRAIIHDYMSWGVLDESNDHMFERKLPWIWSRSAIPMVSWMPMSHAAHIETQIAAGQYDAYILLTARRFKAFTSGPDGIYGNDDDRRVYLRFAHEMNGSWYGYSPAVGGDPPQAFVLMWRRTHALFEAAGLDRNHVAWVWSVNFQDAGNGPPMEELYPGDDYVDWVGIDGYNHGTLWSHTTWKTPAEVFDPMMQRLRALTTKPVGIQEVGSTTLGGSVAEKNTWIRDYFSWAHANGVGMTVWFNADKETDWAVAGGTNGDTTFEANGTPYNGYSEYAQAIADPKIGSTDPGNPRLLDDAAFLGVP